jgi:5-formyltetrahydrofolate cyclo-ligase
VDKNGYRLGYGGGYYDRFLESVMKRNNRPLLIGLIYDFQFIDDSINELHDIKLDIVFSEKQSKKFS